MKWLSIIMVTTTFLHSVYAHNNEHNPSDNKRVAGSWERNDGHHILLDDGRYFEYQDNNLIDVGAYHFYPDSQQLTIIQSGGSGHFIVSELSDESLSAQGELCIEHFIKECTHLSFTMKKLATTILPPESHNLSQAISYGDATAVENFIAQLEHVDALQENDTSALALAANAPFPHIVALLLARGADANFVIGNGKTPLILAIEQEYFDNTRILLASGANVNKALDNNETPLLLAAGLNSFPIFKLLIDSGADIYAINNDETVLGTIITPDFFSDDAALEKIDFIRYLFEVGGLDIKKATANNNLPALFQASIFMLSQTIDYLIEQGADVNALDENSDNILLYSISNITTNDIAQPEFIKIIKLLINQGLNLSYSNPNNGISPLFLASKAGADKLVALLLESGANANQLNKDNDTALIYLLRENIFNPNMREDHFVNTINLLLTSTNFTIESLESIVSLERDTIRKLTSIGFDINYQEPQHGISLLFLASQQGKAPLTELLLELGAHAEQRNYNNDTPLMYLLRKNAAMPHLHNFDYKDTIDVLLKVSPKLTIQEINHLCSKDTECVRMLENKYLYLGR